MLEREFLPEHLHSPDKLSAVITADSFVYCLFDPSGTIIGHKRYDHMRFSDAETWRNLKQDPWITREYSRKEITIWGGPLIIVQEDQEEDVAFFPDLAGYAVKKDKISSPDAMFCYGLTRHQEAFLRHIFHTPDISVCHAASRLHHFLCDRMKNGLLVHFEEHSIGILCFKDGSLRLFNTYSIASPKDILYFVLAVMQETGLTPGHDDIWLSGWIDVASSSYQTLTWYTKAKCISSAPFHTYPIQNGNEGWDHTWFLHQTAVCAS